MVAVSEWIALQVTLVILFGRVERVSVVDLSDDTALDVAPDLACLNELCDVL